MKKSIILNLLLIYFSLISCNRENKQNEKKSKIESEKCAHIDVKKNQSPPPLLNHILSTETITLKSKNHDFLLTVKLIADKNVDIEGLNQQIFKIDTKNKFRNQEFYFALPTKYNEYWNELKIYKNKTVLNIGFENESNIYYLYNISLHKLEESNKGLIEIKTGFKKQSKSK